jgi:hypothetical protein
LQLRGNTARPNYIYNDTTYELALSGDIPTNIPTKYAGSSSAGGAATSANKLNTNAGAADTPVYFKNGIPVVCRKLVGENVEGQSFKLLSTDGYATAGEYAEMFNGCSIATGEYSHAEGNFTEASGNTSHAEGDFTIASGAYSHAEGRLTVASGMRSHAEGHGSVASGVNSHAEGSSSSATGLVTHAEGGGCIASGSYSHAEGYYATALAHQHAQGHYNNTTTAKAGYGSGTGSGTAFVVGNGISSSNSNAFRIDYNGTPYAKAALTTTGADYAEYFEWHDLNPEAEDRRGLFVTLDEDKIRIAGPNDFILGIVSGQPSVIGNGDEDWMGRYLFDEYGCFVYEDFVYEVEEPIEVVNKETGEVHTETKLVKKTGKKYKENPSYDKSLTYIQRSERPEWSAVGMVGVLSVRDDGTCKVNGYCKVAEGGIATKATSGYRVIKRVNDHIVKVVLK